MQIQQPWELFAGVLLLLLGVPGLARDLYRTFTHQFRFTYADLRTLGLSLWFTAAGPEHVSRAFDPAYGESHRTGVLGAVALPVFLVAVAACGLAWMADWRRVRRERASAGADQPAV